jgi:uncharacterized coiled-coil protein SlyX
MKKAIEIKSEIDKTDSRITELQTQLTEQTTTFEAVQQAFVSGKSDVNQLHAEQSKLTLISQGVEALKTTYQKLTAAFENQSEQEKRTELLKQMKTTANEVEPLVDDYLKTRNEFHELAKEYAEKLFAGGKTYRSKQSEYRGIIAELKPTAAEIQASGLDQKTLRMAEAAYFNHPALEYGEVVHLAENLLTAKLNNAAQAETTEELNERQLAAKRQEEIDNARKVFA